jgi:hypothetical protein
MNIPVEYIDQNGNTHNQTHRLTRLAFVKHLAIAGQHYAPSSHKFLNTLASLFVYKYYIQRDAFNNNRFSEPPINFSDPTRKGQFSNLAGKAIADFLSKRINQSVFTVDYEAAMRMRSMPIVGGRPDLLAFTRNGQFAVEAKGYSGGHGNMVSHKAQSQTGGIPVNFSVACVSYDLYNNVKCKYHDPFNDNIPYDNNLLQQLTANYYSGFSEYLDQRYFRYNEIEIQGENFIAVTLDYIFFEKYFDRDFSPFPHHWYHDIIEFYRPSLLLPSAIRQFATNGITNENKPFIFDSTDNDYTYVDNDRIGLQIRR